MPQYSLKCLACRRTFEIEAGICGFRTRAVARSDDDRHVVLEIESDCQKIQGLAGRLAERAPFDAYQEISAQTPSRLMARAGECLDGCCVACAVPVGLFKAMQVAAGLALPRDVNISLTKVSEPGPVS